MLLLLELLLLLLLPLVFFIVFTVVSREAAAEAAAAAPAASLSVPDCHARTARLISDCQPAVVLSNLQCGLEKRTIKQHIIYFNEIYHNKGCKIIVFQEI